jgi:hypothetical protein
MHVPFVQGSLEPVLSLYDFTVCLSVVLTQNLRSEGSWFNSSKIRKIENLINDSRAGEPCPSIGCRESLELNVTQTGHKF